MTDISTREASSIVSTPSRVDNIEAKWEIEDVKPVIPIKSILRQSTVKEGRKAKPYAKDFLYVKQKIPKVSFQTNVTEIHEIDNLEELEFGNKEHDRECCTMF